MWKMNPQLIPEGLEVGLFAALPAGMQWLVQDGRRGESQEVWRRWVRERTGGAARGEAEGSETVPGAAAACLEAGLWLLEGELDRAHRICQEIPTALGAAWHGVVHRQEGDFWNSKYWWRRVGSGVNWDKWIGELRGIVRGAPGSVAEDLERLGRSYDPARFVDLVEMHRGSAEVREVLLDVQRWEWAALFVETWEAGRSPG